VGGLAVGYINGAEWFETQARLKRPNPRFCDGEYRTMTQVIFHSSMMELYDQEPL